MIPAIRFVGGPYDGMSRSNEEGLTELRIKCDGDPIFSHHYKILDQPVAKVFGMVTYGYEGCMLTWDHHEFTPNRKTRDQCLVQMDWNVVEKLMESLNLELHVEADGYEVDDAWAVVSGHEAAIRVRTWE